MKTHDTFTQAKHTSKFKNKLKKIESLKINEGWRIIDKEWTTKDEG